MKQLNNYIQEKFEINNKTKPITTDIIIQYMVKKNKCAYIENSPCQKSNDEFFYDFRLSEEFNKKLKIFFNSIFRGVPSIPDVQNQLNSIIPNDFKVIIRLDNDGGGRIFLLDAHTNLTSILMSSYIYLDYDNQYHTLYFCPGKQLKVQQITKYIQYYNEIINILDYIMKNYTK